MYTGIGEWDHRSVAGRGECDRIQARLGSLEIGDREWRLPRDRKRWRLDRSFGQRRKTTLSEYLWGMAREGGGQMNKLVFREFGRIENPLACRALKRLSLGHFY